MILISFAYAKLTRKNLLMFFYYTRYLQLNLLANNYL